jgi:hypothetical protein
MMGIFDWLFGKTPKPTGQFQGDFKLLNGYTPHFTSYGGEVYESELIRAAINARATHISKLKVEISGAAQRSLQAKLRHAPNSLQTWSQFLYRLSTILDVHNTAFIVPVFDEYGEISGVYTPLTTRCEAVQFGGKPYLRYKFQNGDTAAIELDLCGIMTKFQYKNDLFGDSNMALLPTMSLIHIQNQGIEEGVKSAATYRFIAQADNFIKPSDLANERKRFTANNLAADGGGLLLFPYNYKNIQQVNSKPFVVDADQMKVIREGVFEYFGVNEDVLTNKAYGDQWSAFYEGVCEAFAIQFSEVMSAMLFSPRERSQGNMVMATANRLQYLSNKDKLDVSVQLVDRGVITLNDAREIWNMPPVEGGDVRIIRGEYYNADEKVEEQTDEEGNQSV